MKTNGSQGGGLPGPLEAYVDSFLDDQRAAGYSPNTLAERRAVAVAFARWAETEAIAELSLGEEHVKAFIRRQLQSAATEHEQATARRFLAHLRARGVLPPAESGPGTPADALVARYTTFLRQDRGLAENSILVYAPCAREFLAYRLAQAGTLALDKLDAETIRAFLLSRIRNRSSESSRLVTVALRSLLRFLFLRGETPRDFSAAVPTIRTYRQAGVPALLTPEEVEQVLASADRSTPRGRRDYAILLLLARLGMRASEVVSLELGDLRWRTGELVVRGKGPRLAEPANTLRQFVMFLEQEGSPRITTALALRWAAARPDVQRATWGRRLSMVRKFAAWLSASDPQTEVPPRGLLPSRHRRARPHIYTQAETQSLMVAAARGRSRTGLRPLTYTTLIGLLAAAGLRPGEALALDRTDVDLQNGILFIRETKFGKSRFVPVAATTRLALQQYAARRDTLCPCPRVPAFFLSERGLRLVGTTVRAMFVRLSRTVGLRPANGSPRAGRGPRLQDFRHSFVTRRLVEWYRARMDVTRELPKLSTYVGHTEVRLTYWYIEAVPELLTLATERLSGPQDTGGVQ